MNTIAISQSLRKKALVQLQNEANDVALYTILASKEKSEKNRELFLKMAADEKSHYDFCATITGEQRDPKYFLVKFIILTIGVFGTSFVLKFMENRESGAKEFYNDLQEFYPGAKQIHEEEVAHELELIDMFEDKKLLYAGAIVLGMNDALIELTGTLSGMALAFGTPLAVGSTGLIIGAAASLSMGSSAYLEAKENKTEGVNPLRYSIYTGLAYVVTTAILISPFFILGDIFYALAVMFLFAFFAIFCYNFYISVAKGVPFWRRVIQMSLITFGVAIISFGIGLSVKYFFGI